MQHDGTRWRCLVACAYPRRPDRFFPRIRRREFFGPDRIRMTPRGNRRRQFVPPPDAWLHEPYAGNAGLAGVISTARNTWRILVFSGENFFFQYFIVIMD